MRITILAVLVAAVLVGCKSPLFPFGTQDVDVPELHVENHNYNHNPHYPSRDGKTIVVGGESRAGCSSCCGGSVVSCGGSSSSSSDMMPVASSDHRDSNPVTLFDAQQRGRDECTNGQCGVPLLWEPPTTPDLDRSRPLRATPASFDLDPLTLEPLPLATEYAGPSVEGLAALVAILFLIGVLGAYRFGRASSRG